MTHSSFTQLAFLNAPSGAKLAYRHLVATGQAKGVLLINHGLVEHSGRYSRFAEFMSAQGYHIYAHDHRGHGRTTASDAPFGQFSKSDGLAKVLLDVKTMRDFAASQHIGLPIILLGHSMGGLIALNYAVSNPSDYDALAIMNSNLNPGLMGRAAQVFLRITQFFKGSDVPSILLPKATFETWNKQRGDGRTKADWLSHDTKAVDDYINDPLCQFEPHVSMWQTIFEMSYRAPKLLSRIPHNTPVLLVGGGQDPATNDGKKIIWLGQQMTASGLSSVSVKIYPEFRHETLNEIDHQQSTDDFLAWANSAIAKKTH